MSQEPTRGAPPKRGATASAIINVRVDVDRKNHYTRFAKQRRKGDKTLAGLVIETLDAATGYREGPNVKVQPQLGVAANMNEAEDVES